MRSDTVTLMPLAKGSDRATISRNIAEMIKAGHPPKVAEAAAFRMAGEKRPAKPKGKR